MEEANVTSTHKNKTLRKENEEKMLKCKKNKARKLQGEARHRNDVQIVIQAFAFKVELRVCMCAGRVHV